MGEEYSSFGRISMLYAVCLTSGLHGPRVRLIMPKHFEDFEPDDELDADCTSTNFFQGEGMGGYKSRRLPEITVLPTESG